MHVIKDVSVSIAAEDAAQNDTREGRIASSFGVMVDLIAIERDLSDFERRLSMYIGGFPSLYMETII